MPPARQQSALALCALTGLALPAQVEMDVDLVQTSAATAVVTLRFHNSKLKPGLPPPLKSAMRIRIKHEYRSERYQES